MNEKISHQIREVFEKISGPEMDKVVKKCRREAIFYILENHKHSMIPWIVRKDGKIGIMHHLGNMEKVEGCDFFYDSGAVYKRKEYSRDVIPEVEDCSDIYIDNDFHRERFFKYLDDYFCDFGNKKMISEFQETPSIFIFRFTFLRMFGKREIDSEKRIIGIRCDYVRDAIREFERQLFGLEDGCFSDFELLVDGQWNKIRTHRPVFRFNLDSASFLIDEIEKKIDEKLFLAK